MSDTECRSRRGNFVTNSSVQLIQPGGLEAQNPNWDALMDDLPTFQWGVRAPIQLQGITSITPLSGLITEGSNHTNSHLGLGENSVLLSELQKSGQIRANSWALDSGSTSYHAPRGGRLTLGGFDPERVMGSFSEFDMSQYNKTLGTRFCPLQVAIAELNLRIGDQSRTLIAPDSNVHSCLEP